MAMGDKHFMQFALDAAKQARQMGEVPIGACLVDKHSEILAVSGNRSITNSDPTAHAEILVIREAAEKLGNYRLTECSVYTTIEPCIMCAGALVNARITKLVFGAYDERFGGVRSKFNICDSSSLNHKIEIRSGILESECRKLMQDFFRAKRKGPKENT